MPVVLNMTVCDVLFRVYICTSTLVEVGILVLVWFDGVVGLILSILCMTYIVTATKSSTWDDGFILLF